MKTLTFHNWTNGELNGRLCSEGSLIARASVNGTEVYVYVEPLKNNQVKLTFKRVYKVGTEAFYRNKPNFVVCDRTVSAIVRSINAFFKTDVLSDMAFVRCCL